MLRSACVLDVARQGASVLHSTGQDTGCWETAGGFFQDEEHVPDSSTWKSSLHPSMWIDFCGLQLYPICLNPVMPEQNTVTALFNPVLSWRLTEGCCCLKVPTFHLLVLIRVVLGWKWVWSIGVMKLTENNETLGQKPVLLPLCLSQISHDPPYWTWASPCWEASSELP